MKKALLVVLGVTALLLVWYLLSPLWRTSELHEASPLEATQQNQEDAVSSDVSATSPEMLLVITDMNQLPSETRAQIEAEMDDMKDVVMEMNDESPVEKQDEDVVEGSRPLPRVPELLAQAPFMASAHDVEGSAQLIETAEGKVLRFEDFETVNGPNLHIYLSADLEARDYVDLGAIKATKGNVNYVVPPNVDTNKYNKVMVWCVPFRVLFSYADLQ